MVGFTARWIFFHIYNSQNLQLDPILLSHKPTSSETRRFFNDFFDFLSARVNGGHRCRSAAGLPKAFFAAPPAKPTKNPTLKSGEIGIPTGSFYGIFTYLYHKNQPFMYGKYTIPMNPYGYRSLYIETLQVVSCHATNFKKWKFLSDDDEPSYYPLLETNSEKQTTNLRCTNPNTKPPHQKK